MWHAKKIRQTFLDYFEEKGHKIVPSAPVVNSDDPTLMFINSGMAQFKDYFLGNAVPENPRIADTQKCLRVSGKHNDLEDVGKDSYHQTLFEMLGNWSFGDYFKEEAIAWSWDLLTKVYGIEEDRMYVTVFSGDEADRVPADEEACEIWKKWVADDRILPFDKKDNFWEMGAQGPCGPCAEIHIDLRSDEERQQIDGSTLVNKDHPQVIEIWNLVFMQYNRMADGHLEPLQNKCIDTGMGLERLCMVLQAKNANYETDLFAPIIQKIEALTNNTYTNQYGDSTEIDTAIRVIADHVRAVALVIADGQQPSNTGAGYVVRRILRRAVRYAYSFLNVREPMICHLVDICADLFDAVFPELNAQRTSIKQTIEAEERSFLKTLERGLQLFAGLTPENNSITGKDAFVLFDTYGFPIDLTMLLASEKNLTVDLDGFNIELDQQKKRSKVDAQKDVDDWFILRPDSLSTFVGYDSLHTTTQVIKYRKVTIKNKELYQIVLGKTPFYPEGGGQVGDQGWLYFNNEKITVFDTKKENNLIIHWVNELPNQIDIDCKAQVNEHKRNLTENNHSTAHLVHAALRQILGNHVQQKGSFVSADKMRFDFSHHTKMTQDEIDAVQQIVNDKIRQNIILKEERDVPIEMAKQSGALMLFGEKYGETVRIITFDDDFSKELCGGCHVDRTGQIGFFKLVSESSIATGVRRVEAITAKLAEDYLDKEVKNLAAIKHLLKNPKDPVGGVADLLAQNKALKKEVEKIQLLEAKLAVSSLKEKIESIGNIHFLGQATDIQGKDGIKSLFTSLQKDFPNLVLVLGHQGEKKMSLHILISDAIVTSNGLHAGNMIKQVAKHIQGGGGGQANFASAGGKNPEGLSKAIDEARQIVKSSI